MGWVINAMPRPLNPQEWPGTHRTGGWVGPMAGLEGCRKTRPPPPPPGFDLRTVHPAASRYTDWALPAPRRKFIENKIVLFCSQSLLRVTNTQSLLAALHDALRCNTHLASCGTPEFWALRSCGADLTKGQLHRKGQQRKQCYTNVSLATNWVRR
jgi:hypothetical protein